MTDKEICYKKIGTLCTQPDGVLSPVKVQGQQIYVVVGFGVNSPAAYKDGVHYLNVDPGHAFMYTVRNNKVTKFFSFGPVTHGEFVNTQGTPDYGMDYPTRLFKVPLSAEQMNKVEATVDKYRKEISDGKMKYRGVTNDTCAETVRQILSESGVSTPNGTGPVAVGDVSAPNPVPDVRWRQTGTNAQWPVPIPYPEFSQREPLKATPTLDAVNPYKWYDEFKKSGKYKEVQFEAHDKNYWSFYTRFGNPDPVAGKW